MNFCIKEVFKQLVITKMDKINVGNEILASLPGRAKMCLTTGKFDEACDAITSIAEIIYCEGVELDEAQAIISYITRVLGPAFRSTPEYKNSVKRSQIYQTIRLVENALTEIFG